MMFLRFWHNHRSTWRERGEMWSDRRFKEGPEWDGIRNDWSLQNCKRKQCKGVKCWSKESSFTFWDQSRLVSHWTMGEMGKDRCEGH